MGIPAPLGVAASGAPPAGDQANAVISGTFAAVGPGKAFAFRGPMNVALWASATTTLTTTANSLTATVGSGTGLAAGGAINSKNLPAGTTWATFSGTSGTLAMPTITLPGSYSPASDTISGLASTAGLVGATITATGIPSSTTVLAVKTAAVAATNDSPGVLGSVQISKAPTSASSPLNAAVPIDFALTSSAVTAGADANAVFTGAALSYSGTVQLERSFDGGSTWICANVGGGGQLAQYNAGTPVSLTFGEPEKNVLWRLNCIAYTSGTINYRISATGEAATSLAVGAVI